MEAEINLLDLAADPDGNGPPHALGRRLPAMIALLLRSSGINARHASATVRLDDESTGWAVPAGVLDEGKAIELSHRMGNTQLLAFGELGPPKSKGKELPLMLHVLRREDAKVVLEVDKDFYEEEVAHIALDIALALADLLGKRDDVEAIEPNEALGTRDSAALLSLHEGLDGLTAAEGGVSGSDVGRSVELLFSALERDPKCAVATDHSLSALSAYADKTISIERALELSHRLFELSGKDPRVILLVARLHLRRQETDQAKTLLIETLREGGPDPSLVAELSRVLNSLGEHDEAIRRSQSILDAPRSEPLEVRLEASLCEELGIALAKLGRLKKARLQLARSVELDADQPKTWANLGRCHHLLGHSSEAAAAYEKSLSQEPRSWEAARNYAELLVAQGDLTRAEELLMIWAEERPDDLLPILALGELLSTRPGRETDALDLIESKLDLFTGDPRIHALLGGLFTQLERHEKAETHYREALRLAPDDPALLSNLAVVLSHRGDHSEAEQLARRAVELDPSDHISHKVLAHIRNKN